MALIKCSECGNDISTNAEKCPSCGNPLEQSISIIKKEVKPKEKQTKPLKNFIKTNQKVSLIAAGCLLVIIAGIIALVVHKNNVEKEKLYNSLPIKVDISMTSNYGQIDYILYELGLDFDLVTMGANCYTGVQKNQFKTEKYGILYTEFRYCKSNGSTIFRVYNDSKDQELREPKPGELSTFDEYGEKIKEGNNSL